MKYFLLFASGVFVIAIAIGAFMNYRHCPHVLRRLSATIRQTKYIPAADIKFRGIQMAAYGEGPRGSKIGSSSVVSSDCVMVGWEMYYFPTPIDAEEQFQEWVRSATKVILITGDPNAVERAELQSIGEEKFRIISKGPNSKEVRLIWSDSLEHALLYEKQEKDARLPYPFRPLMGAPFLSRAKTISGNPYSRARLQRPPGIACTTATKLVLPFRSDIFPRKINSTCESLVFVLRR